MMYPDAWRYFCSSLKENVATEHKLQTSLLQNEPWILNLKQETQPVTFLQTWVVRELYWERFARWYVIRKLNLTVNFPTSSCMTLVKSFYLFLFQFLYLQNKDINNL